MVTACVADKVAILRNEYLNVKASWEQAQRDVERHWKEYVSRSHQGKDSRPAYLAYQSAKEALKGIERRINRAFAAYQDALLEEVLDEEVAV